MTESTTTQCAACELGKQMQDAREDRTLSVDERNRRGNAGLLTLARTQHTCGRKRAKELVNRDIMEIWRHHEPAKRELKFTSFQHCLTYVEARHPEDAHRLRELDEEFQQTRWEGPGVGEMVPDTAQR